MKRKSSRAQSKPRPARSWSPSLTEDNDDSVKYGDGIQSISSFMSQHGFTAVTYDPWQRKITAKHKRSDNTLYLRDIENVQRRVAEAEPFHVFGRSI
jgi:hypothetical protein